jgi:excisionase family DNA binding protein
MSIKEAAQALGIGRSTTYSLIAEGKLLTICIGRRRLVRADSVRSVALGEAA